ncbi:MAG: LysR family transcriptional regulator [Rhodocyclaceae bacterium]|nr:LysR family transcriptional regulator [Rhodocyclaceae bacterium]
MKFDASLKDIALFVAVFEERSFTLAAERENATQSGVSQPIRKLEERFGVELFVRQGRYVKPTPAAETYYRGCIDLLRDYEVATRRVRSFSDGLRGEVSLGLTATMTRAVLAPTIIKFTALHPNVKVNVIESHPRMLAHHVQAGELDFAIVPAPLEHVGLKGSFFIRTPEVLVSAAGSDLRHCAPVELARIEELKLLMPGNPVRRKVFERYFAAAGVRIARQMELDVVFTMLDIVQASDWHAVFPALMMAPEITEGRLTISPMARPAFWFDCMSIEPLRRPLSNAAHAFHAALQSEARLINRSATRRLKAQG